MNVENNTRKSSKVSLNRFPTYLAIDRNVTKNKIVEITVFYVQCATLCIEFRYSEASVVLETIQISGTALRLNH